MVVAAVTGAVVSLCRKRSIFVVCCLTLAGSGLLAPTTAEAVEFRRDEDLVAIGADEVIDDTLFIAGETVLIEGTVEGNLFAAGSRVIVSGSVTGNLFVAGESVTVSGAIGGLVVAAGSSLEFESAVLGGDVFGAGEQVTIDGTSRAGRNALLAGETVIVNGAIERDLFSAAQSLELNGRVGRDVGVTAGNIRLLGNAVVDGDLRIRSDDDDPLQRAPSSVVRGEIKFLPLPVHADTGSRYLSGDFYLTQLLLLVSAFLAGAVLLWLAPGLRTLTPGGGVEALKTAGMGLLTLVGLPVAAVLCAITIVGLPFAAAGLFAWLAAIYLAKIVLASVVGRMLLASSPKAESWLWTLLAGLVVIRVVVSVPFLGGIFNFLLTGVGLGVIARVIYDRGIKRDRVSSGV